MVGFEWCVMPAASKTALLEGISPSTSDTATVRLSITSWGSAAREAPTSPIALWLKLGVGVLA
ncbi:hypothetical protein ARTHRO9V_280022 [Arthrobacter sp. 9V]|nr:hypothetical protein ARTHRO9V_280022 [Arthrobacter sp. 9V]